ncbi:hypothetical protein HS125_11075 [bacterium]|nr:hypothetical protein [bacterium]
MGLLSTARSRERKIHAALPELWLQAAVFEIVSEGKARGSAVGLLRVQVPHRARNFSYNDMLYPDGRYS